MASPLAANAQAASVLALRGERRLVIGVPIGTGSQGTVYVARLEQPIGGNEMMARPVAVKIIDPALCRDPETMHELRRAFRRTALVTHPSVVHVTDYFSAQTSLTTEPAPCIVQELVDGMSLATFAARYEKAHRRMPLDLALFIACEIAEALEAARSARNLEGAPLLMAHHDLSPRQVQLSWHGEVKVGDFGWRPSGGVISGVRRATDDLCARTIHMAPEVACGGRGDGRSDVFSLGVMLHEMLLGPRFPRTNPRETIEHARSGYVHRPVPSPILPNDVSAILDRMLEVDPRARQPHAGVVAYDLRRAALALGVGDGRVFLRNALFEMCEGT